MLTHEYLKSLLHYSIVTGIFTRLLITNSKQKIGEAVGTIDDKGYVRIGISGKYYRAHRLAWFYVTGEWPKDQVDHKNTIRTHNEWLNLREADNAKNQYNRRMKNKTGFKGVAYINGWYVAKIRYKRNIIHLGSFKTAIEASDAYNKAAEWYAEEFKRLI